MLKKIRENKKGFTLAELLIVVAIIAVLVAISIPVFTTQLEKSREATDAANIRAAYAEVMTDADEVASEKVELKQTQDGWQNTEIKDIGGIDVSKLEVGKDKTAVITYNPNEKDTSKQVTITIQS